MTPSAAMTDRKRTLIFINIIITVSAAAFMSTALTTALPAIMDSLSLTAAKGQWLTSGFSLVMAIMIPITAFLTTRIPTRPLYLVSIAVFIIGLGICATARSFGVMMVGRVIQACADGNLFAMGQIILLTIYPKERQGTVMGWFGLSFGVIPVVAPMLAGVIVDLLSWRMVFYIPIAIMVISLIYAVFVFDNVLETQPGRLDVLSFLLCAVAFGGVTLGLGNLSTLGLRHMQVWLPLALGVIASVFFTVRQLRTENPLLNLRVLRCRAFAICVVGSMLLYFITMACAVMLPIYVQSIVGASATVSAAVLLPGSLLMALISPFTGKLYDKTGVRALLIAGSLGTLLGSLGMVFVTVDTPLWVAAVLNTVRNGAIGCIMMPIVTWGIGAIPERGAAAHGTAINNSLRTVAGAIGAAVLVGVMSAVAEHTQGNAAAASMRGVNVAFVIMSAIALVMLVCSLVMIRPEKSKKALDKVAEGWYINKAFGKRPGAGEQKSA